MSRGKCVQLPEYKIVVKEADELRQMVKELLNAQVRTELGNEYPMPSEERPRRMSEPMSQRLKASEDPREETSPKVLDSMHTEQREEVRIEREEQLEP